MAYVDAATIHARLGSSGWTETLRCLGVAEQFLKRRKAGPCPICGGRDRFVYDNRRGRGDYFCRQCGAGDGFSLLMRLNGWNFAKTCTKIAQAGGITFDRGRVSVATPRTADVRTPAEPTARVREILRSVCEPADLADAREYLGSRGLWPLPEQCGLRAHSSLDYWEGPRARAGRYAALIAPVRDVAGELVTVHVTYLAGGRKLSTHEPRKILSPLAGRAGCAVRLAPIADTLGIAEGVETALSAQRLDGIATWSALNATLLAKFEPPPGVRRLVVYADRDVGGLEGAGKLLERLQGRIAVELRTAPPPHNDWNDVLMNRIKGTTHDKRSAICLAEMVPA